MGHPDIPGPGSVVHPGTLARLWKAPPGRLDTLETRRAGILVTPARMVPLATPDILALEPRVTLVTQAGQRAGIPVTLVTLDRPGPQGAMEILVIPGTQATQATQARLRPGIPGTQETMAPPAPLVTLAIQGQQDQQVILVTPGIPAMLRPAIRGILVRPVPQAAMEIQATLGTPARLRLVTPGIPEIMVPPVFRAKREP